MALTLCHAKHRPAESPKFNEYPAHSSKDEPNPICYHRLAVIDWLLFGERIVALDRSNGFETEGAGVTSNPGANQ